MQQQKGVTLVELVIVLAIIAVLSVLAGPSLTQFFAKQKVKTYTSSLEHDIAVARNKARTAGFPVQLLTIVKDTNITGWEINFVPENGGVTSSTAGIDASLTDSTQLGATTGFSIIGCNDGALINDGVRFGIVFGNRGGIKIIDEAPGVVGSVNNSYKTVTAINSKLIISSSKTPVTKIINFSPSGNISVENGINSDFKSAPPKCT